MLIKRKRNDKFWDELFGVFKVELSGMSDRDFQELAEQCKDMEDLIRIDWEKKTFILKAITPKSYIKIAKARL